MYIYFIIIETYEEGYRCEEVVSEDLMVLFRNYSCEFHHYRSPKTKLSDVVNSLFLCKHHTHKSSQCSCQLEPILLILVLLALEACTVTLCSYLGRESWIHQLLIDS